MLFRSKTDQFIYLTEGDAYEELNNNKHFKEYYHVVKLIACLDEELKEIKDQLDYLEQRVYGEEE